jgi:hypothetical protein
VSKPGPKGFSMYSVVLSLGRFVLGVGRGSGIITRTIRNQVVKNEKEVSMGVASQAAKTIKAGYHSVADKVKGLFGAKSSKSKINGGFKNVGDIFINSDNFKKAAEVIKEMKSKITVGHVVDGASIIFLLSQLKSSSDGAKIATAVEAKEILGSDVLADTAYVSMMLTTKDPIKLMHAAEHFANIIGMSVQQVYVLIQLINTVSEMKDELNIGLLDDIVNIKYGNVLQ